MEHPGLKWKKIEVKFLRVGEVGHERPVVEADGKHYSLGTYTKDIDDQFWASGGPAIVAQAVAADLLDQIQIEGQRIGSPIARPGAVVCVGMNYAAHAAESGALPPENPVIFLKTPNTVAGPYDAVAIPKGATKTDWEVELGIVIGKSASYLSSPEQAIDHIGGFVTVNDLSERAFQIEVSGGQWSKGKCSPGFCPVGPWLVTPDDLDYRNLQLRSWVNGSPRQDSTTADQIFSIDYLIWHLSQYMTLDPGDLIITGTPEGVALSGNYPYLKVGDVVEIEIAGLGRQRQQFV